MPSFGLSPSKCFRLLDDAQLPPLDEYSLSLQRQRTYDSLRLYGFSSWQYSPIMDISRVTSPPAIIVYDINRHNDRSAARSFSGSHGPMTIPNAIENPPPPPLPPPRHIDDLAAGSDPGWKWGNSPSRSEGFGKSSGSVSPASSLHGNWNPRMGSDGISGRPDYLRRGTSNSTLKSRQDSDVRYDFSRQIDEGYHSLSGSSLGYQSVYAGRSFPSICIRYLGRPRSDFFFHTSLKHVLLVPFSPVVSLVCTSEILWSLTFPCALKIAQRKTIRATEPREFFSSL